MLSVLPARGLHVLRHGRRLRRVRLRLRRLRGVPERLRGVPTDVVRTLLSFLSAWRMPGSVKTEEYLTSDIAEPKFILFLRYITERMGLVPSKSGFNQLPQTVYTKVNRIESA